MKQPVCLVCGREIGGGAICEECEQLGFEVKTNPPTIMCPTCKGDFKQCNCEAPDHAYM